VSQQKQSCFLSPNKTGNKGKKHLTDTRLRVSYLFRINCSPRKGRRRKREMEDSESKDLVKAHKRAQKQGNVGGSSMGRKVKER
jgi:hypothetical protein